MHQFDILGALLFAVKLSTTDARKCTLVLSFCLTVEAKTECWSTGIVKTCGKWGDNF